MTPKHGARDADRSAKMPFTFTTKLSKIDQPYRLTVPADRSRVLATAAPAGARLPEHDSLPLISLPLIPVVTLPEGQTAKSIRAPGYCQWVLALGGNAGLSWLARLIFQLFHEVCEPRRQTDFGRRSKPKGHKSTVRPRFRQTPLGALSRGEIQRPPSPTSKGSSTESRLASAATSIATFQTTVPTLQTPSPPSSQK